MRQGTNSESIYDWSVSIYLIAQMPQATDLPARSEHQTKRGDVQVGEEWGSRR